MSPNEFRDGLTVHYLKHPVGLPPCCDGYGADFTLQHRMECKKDGLVIQRQNEHVIRSVAICGKGYNSMEGNHVGLRPDLGMKGV